MLQLAAYCGFLGVGEYSLSQAWADAGGKSLRFVSRCHVGDSQLGGGMIRWRDHCWSPSDASEVGEPIQHGRPVPQPPVEYPRPAPRVAAAGRADRLVAF